MGYHTHSQSHELQYHTNSCASVPLLVLTVHDTEYEGVGCPQDQSGVAVLTRAHLVTGTGGGVRGH